MYFSWKIKIDSNTIYIYIHVYFFYFFNYVTKKQFMEFEAVCLILILNELHWAHLYKNIRCQLKVKHSSANFSKRYEVHFG